MRAQERETQLSGQSVVFGGEATYVYYFLVDCKKVTIKKRGKKGKGRVLEKKKLMNETENWMNGVENGRAKMNENVSLFFLEGGWITKQQLCICGGVAPPPPLPPTCKNPPSVLSLSGTLDEFLKMLDSVGGMTVVGGPPPPPTWRRNKMQTRKTEICKVK